MPPTDPPAPPPRRDPGAAPARADDLEWVSPHGPDSDAAMAARGLVRVRTLDRMDRSLPLEDEARGTTPPLAVRPFRPGADDDGFLRVNNRAFAWHPDQSGWDRERLDAALAEPWVDLDGFLVHDDDAGEVDGFCWTRVHPAAGDRPAMGEIFVIAADPDRHGTGLGRALVIAGMDHLAARGLDRVMLYVESDNAPAIALYRRLGYRTDHRDAGYAPVAAPTPEPTDGAAP